jgi:putative ABC transport system permease protein
MFFQNLRHAIRLLCKNLGVTTAALATLAIGIGATTAIFTVAYAVLLKPLPYDQPDQIVSLREVNASGRLVNFTDPNFEDIRAQSSALNGVAEFRNWQESVAGGAEPVRVGVAPVSQDFFSIMRVQPVLGRTFALDEQHFGAAPVALVAHSFWKQFLGARNDLTQIKLTIANQSVSVIGVLPSGFDFPGNAQIWIPRELFERLPSRSAHNWQVIARLRDGITPSKAHAELSSIARQIHQQYAPTVDMTDAAVVRLHDELAAPIRPALVVLLAAVAFLLLVACLNVANLLLAQTSARQSELSIRVALGAKPAQLLSQFLIETLLLSFLGGTLGVLAARVAVAGLLRLAPAELQNIRDISINGPVLAFAFGIMTTVALGLGVFSAHRAIRGGLHNTLATASRSHFPTLSSHRAASIIVVGQLAITLILLTGAGLLGRSLLHVLSVNPGFRTESVLTMDLALSYVDKPEAKTRRIAFVDSLLTRLRAVPGVSDVGGSNYLPLLDSGDHSDGAYVVLSPGQPPPRRMEELERMFHDSPNTGYAAYSVAADGFFTSLGIPLLRGRLFDDRDMIDGSQVAVISESLAREKWPDQEPLGRTIEFGNMDGDLRPLTVIGVVGDLRASSLESLPQPTVYVSYRQRPQATAHLAVVLRSSIEASALIPTVRQLVRDLDPGVPPEFSTFTRIVSSSLRARRFNLLLVGCFAGAALLLAGVGLYGVMAHSVVRRTGEIGVRITLGATRANILRLVLGQGARVTAIGVLIGIAGSLALTRAIRSLLFGLSPADPLTFAAVAFILITVALWACYVPARRASRVDPNVALRYE